MKKILSCLFVIFIKTYRIGRNCLVKVDNSLKMGDTLVETVNTSPRDKVGVRE